MACMELGSGRRVTELFNVRTSKHPTILSGRLDTYRSLVPCVAYSRSSHRRVPSRESVFIRPRRALLRPFSLHGLPSWPISVTVYLSSDPQLLMHRFSEARQQLCKGTPPDEISLDEVERILIQLENSRMLRPRRA